MSTFQNLHLTAPHGSYAIPDPFYERLSNDFRANDDRLLKNCSDWGTSFLCEQIKTEDPPVIAKWSRVVGDPNRPTSPKDARSSDLFRMNDFAGIPIWKEGQAPTKAEQKALLREGYFVFWNQQIARITQTAHRKDPQFHFDIHDTSQFFCGVSPEQDTKKNYEMPLIELNGDPNLVDPFFLETLQGNFEQVFDVRPEMNQVFPEGGYITRALQEAVAPTRERIGQFAAIDIEKLPEWHHIQVEIQREAYMNNETQEIDEVRAQLLAAQLQTVFQLTMATYIDAYRNGYRQQFGS